jgi:hypothetical protein
MKMELQKHTLNLRKGDVEAIADAYASSSVPASVVIRTIIANFVDRLNGPPPKVELDHVEGVDL